MSDATASVQKALYETLTAALAAGSPNIPVYDFVPQGAAYPYVCLDSMVTVPEDGNTARRDYHYCYLSVWSRAHGQKEIHNIMAAINDALHHSKLPLDDGTMVMCYVDGRQTMREPDNLTFHGAVKLKILTQP